MTNFFAPEPYELGLEYWPYKDSLAKVIEIIVAQAPQNGSLLDVMCGPGFLLGKIAEQRPDLSLKGSDLDEKHIAYAQRKYPALQFKVEDILRMEEDRQYDVVTCTGALHHLPYDRQEEGIRRIASVLRPGGFAIVSDAHIDDYNDEEGRKKAAFLLGSRYITQTIENGAPTEVIMETHQIRQNDVNGLEFKTSIEKRLPLLQGHFGSVDVIKIWPDKQVGGFGDYVMVCR